MIDSELIYIFGISAIGAVSIAYVLFGFSSNSSKQNKVYIRGLKNVKNNCFINSILQSFASSESMVNWLDLINRKFENDSNLIFQLSMIVDRINNKINSEEVLTPEGVLDSLRKHRWVFTSDEQDAFELFSVLISTLDIEFNHLSFVLSIRDSLSIIQATNIDELTNKIKLISRVSGSVMEIASNLKYSLPTRGILSNHLSCQNCLHNYPIHFDVFDSISLSLPPETTSNNSILLERCLSKFIAKEEIEDFLCQYCNKKSTFTKRIELIKLPHLLCFHLQRLLWSAENQPLKRTDHIKFPDILIMDPFKYSWMKSKNSQINQQKNNSIENLNGTLDENMQIASSKQKNFRTAQYVYILNSIIVHLGNNRSGHFICYRRKYDILSKKIKWFYTSDLIVKEVSKKEVFSSCAYMLFYERIKNK